MEQLNPRVRLVWGLAVTVSALLVGGILTGILYFQTSLPAWLGVAAGLAVLLVGLTHTILRYRIWRFEVQDDALFLQRGVLTRIRTVVPYVRIQHVDTQRNPIERIVGISSVVIYTAGSRGADVTIPGLTPQRATDLQEQLRSLIGASESEDAV